MKRHPKWIPFRQISPYVNYKKEMLLVLRMTNRNILILCYFSMKNYILSRRNAEKHLRFYSFVSTYLIALTTSFINLVLCYFSPKLVRNKLQKKYDGKKAI